MMAFKLVTKLVYWDERSLYFEQSFVSLNDGFVRAVALCKNTCVGGTVTVRAVALCKNTCVGGTVTVRAVALCKNMCVGGTVTVTVTRFTSCFSRRYSQSGFLNNRENRRNLGMFRI